ncbi:MAG: hypothetical protein DLM59_03115 [Pseudonocardiales bacterium]|nr:MAG: hypothetical protein DLM59_03115 [Pseudonocardiales bacterium]
MPLTNRVTPLSTLIATPERGLVYGNRGCLHNADGQIRRRYSGRRWIACQLEFHGWHRHPLLQPGRFTELFFLDEATALAAGHRPCALCRRRDYRRLAALWAELHPGQLGAEAIDAQLHDERVDSDTGGQRRHRCLLDELPDGAFVLLPESPHPWLVLGGELLSWRPGGYGPRRPRPAAISVLVLTPPSLLAVLATGWRPLVPLLDPSAVSGTSSAGV